MSRKQRVIKKYPNRRLYDTERSGYITLADVRALVSSSVNFKVVDAHSQEDITRNILLQIIMEQENGGEPLFTTEILSRMIRYYGNSMQNTFTAYLENSISLFAEQQKQLQDQMEGVLRVNPMQTMTQIMQKNLELWRELQEHFTNKNAPSDDGKNKSKN